jgi:hypothetical protein
MISGGKRVIKLYAPSNGLKYYPNNSKSLIILPSEEAKTFLEYSVAQECYREQKNIEI